VARGPDVRAPSSPVRTAGEEEDEMDSSEIIYSDQGRFAGMASCGACLWGAGDLAAPQSAAEGHNAEAHGGRLTVRRVESAEARR
jgi:hypothetical protein